MLSQAPATNPEETVPVPMFSPYHRISWSNGFSFVPPSAGPFIPSSGKMMVQYSSPAKAGNLAAEIGVGTLQTNPCFRLDFSSVHVGCDSQDADCRFNITGLQWDSNTQTAVTVASLTITTKACTSKEGCMLRSLSAGPESRFTNLTSILVDVTADGRPAKWWADDLALSWTDSVCDTADCRSKVRDTVKRARRQGMARMFDATH